MLIRPFLKLFRHAQLAALIQAASLFKQFYKVVYLAAAKESGVLDLLSGQPVGFERIVAACCKDGTEAKALEALEAWLQKRAGSTSPTSPSPRTPPTVSPGGKPST